MDEEDDRTMRPSLPDVFRRVLERRDQFALLPAGAPFPRILGPGSTNRATPMVGEREPATEVLQGPHTIFATTELPGAAREDIDLRATETTLVVDLDSTTRRYYREIPLPSPVRMDSIRATYKNGVLDVSLEKRDKAWRIRVD